MLKVIIGIIPSLTTLCTAVVISAVIAASRTLPAPLPIELPTRYMPGSPLPRESHCDWRLYGGEAMYCNIGWRSQGWFSFAYDPHRKTITRTAADVPDDLTVGDLVLSWGMPSGIEPAGWGTYISWDRRSAYVPPSTFSPRSRVVFVSYQLEPTKQPAWKGFVSHP
jgi:hypothetical protein